MKRSIAAKPRNGQAGISIIELAISIGLGGMLVASATYLFVGQVRGYKDIGSQARLQTMTKAAVQTMNTEIANTGACLANKRYKFTMAANQVQFAYVDLKARHCAATDTVTVLYYVKSGGSLTDTLMEKITCNSNPPRYQGMIRGVGKVTMAVTYYDLNGAVTAAPAKVKALQFSLDVTSGAKSLYAKSRKPTVRVELLN